MRIDTEKPKRPRGRPRAFDPAAAAERILATFWTHGYAATSLDQLAAATGLNRPSLYAAFGDKRAMYRSALAGFVSAVGAEVGAALAKPTLREALSAFYRGAIALYVQGEHGPRGCFVVCTAAVEAMNDAEIREDVARVLGGVDDALTARIAAAQEAGELDADADPKVLGTIAGAILHSLAVRARAGASRRSLEALARSAVDQVCGTAPRTAVTKRRNGRQAGG